MKHHHRHRRNLLVAHQAKQFDRLSRFLPLIDQCCSQVFDAEPQCVNASIASQRKQIAISIGVELRCFRRKADSFAKRPTARRRTGHRAQQGLSRLAPVEKVVVGPEEVLDVEAIVNRSDRPCYALGTSIAPTLLIDGRNRAIGAVELAPLGDQQARDLGVTADSRRIKRLR